MIVNGEPAFGVMVERTSGFPALDLTAQRARLTTRLPELRRCCMKTLRGGRTSRDPPQEPHYRDEVEGPSHV